MTFYLYNDGIGRVELIDSMGSDLTVVNAARVSYGGNKQELDEKDKKLIKYLIKNHHTSPFEHCQITFKFTVPLFVRSQHHRHRTWAFNEISRRYTADNLEFYEPPKWRTQSTDNKQCSDNEFDSAEFDNKLKEHSQKSLDLYNEMVEGGVAREMARMVLPQSLYTSYYGSVNLHNAIHFLKLRLHPHAQWEIQRVAFAMKTILADLYPECMKVYEECVSL
jgi:thymidylate synthase (FAD)